MEIQERLGNDPMAVVTVDPAPPIVTMTTCDENSVRIEPATSCIHSSDVNVTNLSTPKKAVDKELRQPFPVKVYEMLENAEKKEFSHIVSWNAAGTGFMVHDKDHFTKEIVPHYFNLTKYKSFQRQLSLYGFQRVTVGPNKGLRYHEKLRKGLLELVRQMKPVGYKPRNISRLLEQKKKQQLQRGTNILTTTTTTVVKTTTTSTTLVANNPSKKTTNGVPTAPSAIIDNTAPHDVPVTTVLGKSSILDVTATSIPPVVSSNSLIKQEDHDVTAIESKKMQLEQQSNEVHSISPETTFHKAIHVSGSEGSNVFTGYPCEHVRNSIQLHIEHQNFTQAGPQEKPEIVKFEGMYFHLMSPTRELGINVKLKLLEEFNPASSLLRLASKYVTTEYTTKSEIDNNAPSATPETIPITIDTVHNDRPSLLEPFTDAIGTAAAASTASTIAALQTAIANSTALTNESTPTTTHSMLLSAKPDDFVKNRFIDVLDFHSTNITNRI